MGSFLGSLLDCVLGVLALSRVLVWEIQLQKPAHPRGKCHCDFIAALFKTVKRDAGGCLFLLISDIESIYAGICVRYKQNISQRSSACSPKPLRSTGKVTFAVC